METYSVTLPNGEVITKQLPAGATNKQVRSAFAKDMAKFKIKTGDLVQVQIRLAAVEREEVLEGIGVALAQHRRRPHDRLQEGPRRVRSRHAQGQRHTGGRGQRSAEFARE